MQPAVKKENFITYPSFRRKPESSIFKLFWIPAFAGMTKIRTLFNFHSQVHVHKFYRISAGAVSGYTGGICSCDSQQIENFPEECRNCI